jgi:hypothetical protein
MTAIRYFWTNIAANWWAPGDRLASANARSYDYLFGRGYLEAHVDCRLAADTARAGRRRMDSRPAAQRDGFPRRRRAPPDPAWTEPIRQQIPRTIVQRWGELPRNAPWRGLVAA